MYHPGDEPQNTSHRLSPFIRLMIIRFFYILCLGLCASSSSPLALEDRPALCPLRPPSPTGFHFSKSVETSTKRPTHHRVVRELYFGIFAWMLALDVSGLFIGGALRARFISREIYQYPVRPEVIAGG